MSATLKIRGFMWLLSRRLQGCSPAGEGGCMRVGGGGGLWGACVWWRGAGHAQVQLFCALPENASKVAVPQRGIARPTVGTLDVFGRRGGWVRHKG